MSERKTRVDFNAPESLVERADALANLLNISRTQLIIEALSDKMGEITTDTEVRRRISDAYYDGRIEFETVESLLGTEEAMRMKLLRASLDREPPEPHVDADLPTDEEFYDGGITEWTPDDSSESSPTTPSH
jgi:hypothetical protein